MRGLLLCVFIFTTIFQGGDIAAQSRNVIRTVVIDAGHGGKDPGAIGRKVQEKTITLSIALKLGAMIKQNYPDIKVIYTRDRDVFVELRERADIANRNKADLFISIHCNANKSRIHHGAETYVMGLHKTEANLSIAKMENSSILMEQDYETNYEGFDPNSDESYITLTLFQNVFLEQSTQLASIIQEHLASRQNLEDRGVRQAGFMVLYKTTMPSVLIETGFLSNPEEEKFLASAKGQNQIVESVFNAFKKFREKMNGDSKAEEKKFASTDAPLKQQPASTKAQPAETKVQQPASTKAQPAETKVQQPASDEGKEVCYRVQFAMYPIEIPVNSKKFAALRNVKMYRHQGMFKYTTGEKQTVEDALKLLGEVKKMGYKDAFVVAFHGDTRITIEKARSIQGK